MDENKIHEMQLIEQTLQNIIHQKQAFQMELSETEAAFEEVKKSGDEVFKIIGKLMIKADKKKMQEELENKKKLLGLRLKSLEKQEKTSVEKLESLREEFMKVMKKEKK